MPGRSEIFYGQNSLGSSTLMDNTVLPRHLDATVVDGTTLAFDENRRISTLANTRVNMLLREPSGTSLGRHEYFGLIQQSVRFLGNADNAIAVGSSGEITINEEGVYHVRAKTTVRTDTSGTAATRSVMTYVEPNGVVPYGTMPRVSSIATATRGSPATRIATGMMDFQQFYGTGEVLRIGSEVSTGGLLYWDTLDGSETNVRVDLSLERVSTLPMSSSGPFATIAPLVDIDEYADGSGGSDSISDLHISHDGRRMVLGNRNTGFGIGAAGTVQVFQVTMGEWLPLGAAFDGASGSYLDSVGISTRLNASGTRVAFNTDFDDATFEVYEYNDANNAWVQLGNTIDGSGLFGNGSANGNLTLSDAGHRVLVHDYINEYVQVFEYNGVDTWAPTGQIIQGIVGSSQIDMDGSGQRIVNSDGTFNSQQGRFVIYDQSSNDAWVETVVVEGPSGAQDFGNYVSMSSDGTRLAVGTSAAEGRRVFLYEDRDSSWHVMGSGIIKDLFDTTGNLRPSMSPDGGYFSVVNEINSVMTAVTWKYDGSFWAEEGRVSDIDFRATSLHALSASGNALVIAAAINTTGPARSTHMATVERL